MHWRNVPWRTNSNCFVLICFHKIYTLKVMNISLLHLASNNASKYTRVQRWKSKMAEGSVGMYRCVSVVVEFISSWRGSVGSSRYSCMNQKTCLTVLWWRSVTWRGMLADSLHTCLECRVMCNEFLNNYCRTKGLDYLLCMSERVEMERDYRSCSEGFPFVREQSSVYLSPVTTFVNSFLIFSFLFNIDLWSQSNETVIVHDWLLASSKIAKTPNNLVHHRRQ